MSPHIPTQRTPLRRGLACLAAAAIGLPAAMATTTSAEAASPTPDVAELAGKLADQQINWSECADSTLKHDQHPTIDCAKIKVPRDWHSPGDGRTWEIAISYNRLNDVDGSKYQGIMLGNPGGPGGAGLRYAARLNTMFADIPGLYNYVGMDPRGTGESSRASCDITYEDDPSTNWDYYKAAGEQCADHPDAKTITTEQTAYDMDFIRHLLGEDKLNYFGYSYGTWLGNWYNVLFAPNAGRMVLDSGLDVTRATYQHDKEFEPWAFNRRFRLWLLPYVARHDDVYGLGEDPEAIYQRTVDAGVNIGAIGVTNPSGADEFPAAAKRLAEALKKAEETPEQESSSRAGEPVSREVYLSRLKERAKDNPQLTPEVKDQERAINRLAKLPKQGSAPSRRSTTTTVTQTFTDMSFMVRCGDGQYTQGAAFWKAWEQEALRDNPTLRINWPAAYGCHSWKTKKSMPVADEQTYPKTVVLQGELDAQTVWEHGSATGKKLPNTSFIAVDNWGDHGVFPLGTEEVDRPVIEFMRTGKRPANISVQQGVPVADEDKTYEAWARLDKQARHINPPDGPWVGAPGTITPRATGVTGSELMQVTTAQQDFRDWVFDTYGPEGLATLDR